jgi:hypothetical protein
LRATVFAPAAGCFALVSKLPIAGPRGRLATKRFTKFEPENLQFSNQEIEHFSHFLRKCGVMRPAPSLSFANFPRCRSALPGALQQFYRSSRGRAADAAALSTTPFLFC